MGITEKVIAGVEELGKMIQESQARYIDGKIKYAEGVRKAITQTGQQITNAGKQARDKTSEAGKKATDTVLDYVFDTVKENSVKLVHQSIEKFLFTLPKVK